MMPTVAFWLAVGALTLVSVSVVLWPLVRGAHERTASRRARIGAGAFALVLPVTAVSLYMQVGALRALTPLAEPISHRLGNIEMETMAERLAARLRDEPDRVDGWFMLARTYQAMERWGESADAYRQALRLAPDDAELLADLADVVATQNEGDLEGEPRALLEKAIVGEPEHAKALALLAVADFRLGRIDAAIVRWERLAAIAPVPSQAADVARRGLEQARALKKPPGKAP